MSSGSQQPFESIISNLLLNNLRSAAERHSLSALSSLCITSKQRGTGYFGQQFYFAIVSLFYLHSVLNQSDVSVHTEREVELKRAFPCAALVIVCIHTHTQTVSVSLFFFNPIIPSARFPEIVEIEIQIHSFDIIGHELCTFRYYFD